MKPLMPMCMTLLLPLVLACGGTDGHEDSPVPTDPSDAETGDAARVSTASDAGPSGVLGDPCETRDDCNALVGQIAGAKLPSGYLATCEEDVLGDKRCTFICQGDSMGQKDPASGDKALLVCGKLGGRCDVPYGSYAHLCLP